MQSGLGGGLLGRDQWRWMVRAAWVSVARWRRAGRAGLLAGRPRCLRGRIEAVMGPWFFDARGEQGTVRGVFGIAWPRGPCRC